MSDTDVFLSRQLAQTTAQEEIDLVCLIFDGVLSWMCLMRSFRIPVNSLFHPVVLILPLANFQLTLFLFPPYIGSAKKPS